MKCTKCNEDIWPHCLCSATSQDAESARLTGLLCCVLTRGIPVDGPMTDTVTHVCKPGETIEDIWRWADEKTKGSAWIVKVEITQAT